MADNSKLEPRWEKMLWLGKVDVSDEHLLPDGERLMKVRTVRRLPDAVGEGCRWARARSSSRGAKASSERESAVMPEASR